MIVNSLAPLKDAKLIACVSIEKYLLSKSASFSLGESLSHNCNTKVISIDLNERFHETRQQGFFDLLKNGESSLNDVSTHVSENFHTISSGMNKKDFSLLSTKRTHEIFNELRSIYEYVCVELPHAQHFPSLFKIVNIFDGIILVIECERTKWEIAQRFKNILSDSGVNILGTILTNRKFYLPKWLYGKL